MNEGKKFESGTKKVESVKKYSALITLDTLVDFYKERDIEKELEGPMKDKFSNGTTPEEIKEIIKTWLMEDLNSFLKVSNTLDKHIDVTLEGREQGKIDITPDIAKKLRLVITKIEQVIFYLKRQTLTKKEAEKIARVEKKILSLKIYAQGA